MSLKWYIVLACWTFTILILLVPRRVWKSPYKPNIKCSGLHTQQIHKMLKFNARIWFEKMCKIHHLNPSDAYINIKGGNKRVASTIQAEGKKKINQQLKYVHKESGQVCGWVAYSDYFESTTLLQ